MNDDTLKLIKVLSVTAIGLATCVIFLLMQINEHLNTQHLPRTKHSVTSLEISGHDFITLNNTAFLHHPSCTKCTQPVLKLK